MTFEPQDDDDLRPSVIQRVMELLSPPGLAPVPLLRMDPTAQEFFQSSWEEAQGLLVRTRKLRVTPDTERAPCTFRFELDCRYKRRGSRSGGVETVDGTLSGTIRYRPDLFVAPADEPCVLVFIDAEHGLFHPNYSPLFGVVCLGGVEVGSVLLLSDLLEHLYSILTYANFSTTDPADHEAARYFAHAPHALDGLRDPGPLYGGDIS